MPFPCFLSMLGPATTMEFDWLTFLSLLVHSKTLNPYFNVVVRVPLQFCNTTQKELKRQPVLAAKYIFLKTI